MSIKKVIFSLIGLGGVGGGAYFGYYWMTEGRYIESTDNAYLHADKVSVAPKVSGYISNLVAQDNQTVRKGQVLVQIRDTDYRLDLAQAQANLEAQQSAVKTVTQQIILQQASIDQAQANLAMAKVELDRTSDDYKRYKNLVVKGAASRQSFDHAKADKEKAQAQVAASQATLNVQKGQIEVLKAQKEETERAVAQAQAARDTAQQALDDTTIRAPFDGVVGHRSTQNGAYVQPGEQLMVLVPLPGVYAVANFKETQISNMAVGQKVRLEVDAFPDAEIIGHIASFAPATGAQFSLLPPENATGNFTKITQRVPVRISIDNSKWSAALRPGLSVVADVDIRDSNGEPHPEGAGLASSVAPLTVNNETSEIGASATAEHN